MPGPAQYLHALGTGVVLALLLKGCVVQGFKIPSGSMLPTLQIGDHILSSQIAYGVPSPFSDGWLWPLAVPAVDDVVILELPEEPNRFYVKRVVATGGEVVEFRQGALRVDGREREGPDRWPSGAAEFAPVRVPPEHVFVLGDNRDQSIDSRTWGPVKVSSIKGRVFLIYWSQRKSGGSVRWERIGAPID